MKKIFTIGHSNHDIEYFISLLKDNNIGVLADVRSSPYCRYHTQYSQNELKHTLKEAGIKYIFLGKELGARSNNPSNYKNGKLQYRLLAKDPLFLQGIKRLETGLNKNHIIALMCAEKDPIECHRAILVARELVKRHIVVEHILADSSLENHFDMEARILKTIKTPNLDMFKTPEGELEDAYQILADKASI